MRPTRFLIGAIALSVAGSAIAQDAEDLWEINEAPGVLAASVSYDNGLAVVVRCQGESLETYVRGLSLPEPDEGESPSRTIDYAFGDSALRQSSWQISQNGQSLFADLPAPMARRLREGGDMQMRLAAQGASPARRYVVTLPPSPSAINRVLQSCGRPAIDPRDALRVNEALTEGTASSQGEGSEPPGPGRVWLRQPRPEYPDDAIRAGVSGVVVLTCIPDAEGKLNECLVEAERPAGQNFGRYALRAARDARLQPTATGDRIVSFTIRWSLP